MNDAINELLDHVATDPLDLLNKWRAGEVNDDTMFILMQRALLDIKHNTVRVANPEQFAAQRKQQVAARAELKPEQKFVNNVIDAIKCKDGKFSVPDSYYSTLLSYAKSMFADGLRPGQFHAANIAAGRYAMFHNYDSGMEFTDLIDHLTDKNHGE